MNLSEEAKSNIKRIKEIETKYHFMVFRMAVVNLIDMGYRNIDDNIVENGIKQIMEQSEQTKDDDKQPIITPDFQCEILRCSGELAKFSILTLLVYIKIYFHIDI